MGELQNHQLNVACPENRDFSNTVALRKIQET